MLRPPLGQVAMSERDPSRPTDMYSERRAFYDRGVELGVRFDATADAVNCEGSFHNFGGGGNSCTVPNYCLKFVCSRCGWTRRRIMAGQIAGFFSRLGAVYVTVAAGDTLTKSTVSRAMRRAEADYLWILPPGRSERVWFSSGCPGGRDLCIARMRPEVAFAWLLDELAAPALERRASIGWKLLDSEDSYRGSASDMTRLDGLPKPAFAAALAKVRKVYVGADWPANASTPLNLSKEELRILYRAANAPGTDEWGGDNHVSDFAEH